MVTHRPRAWELAIEQMRLLLAEQNSLFASYKEAIANTVCALEAQTKDVL